MADRPTDWLTQWLTDWLTDWKSTHEEHSPENFYFMLDYNQKCP